MNMRLPYMSLIALTAWAWTGTAEILDVRETFATLEAYCATSKYSRISSVEEFGFSTHSLGSSPLIGAIAAVSNHWSDIIADWDYYSTNGTARMLLGNVICHSGTNAYLSIWSGLLEICATNNAKCPPAVIEQFAFPSAFPLYQYAQLNYQIPAVSNCLYRTSLLLTNDVQDIQLFNRILSGQEKEEIEDERTLDNADWSK